MARRRSSQGHHGSPLQRAHEVEVRGVEAVRRAAPALITGGAGDDPAVRAGQARGFYIVLAGGLVGGALISLIPDFEPAQALFYTQVLDGLMLPPFLLLLLILSNDRSVMGGAHNPRWINVITVIAIFLVVAADFVALLPIGGQ